MCFECNAASPQKTISWAQAAPSLSLKRRREEDSGSGIPSDIKAEMDSASAGADGQPAAKQQKLAADTVSTAAGGAAPGGTAAAAQQPAGPEASGAAGQAAGAAAEARLLSDVDPSLIQSRYWPVPLHMLLSLM